MKKYLSSVLILIFNLLHADSIVYYYSDSSVEPEGYVLKKIENIKYSGLYNDELLIFQIQQISEIDMPDNLPESYIDKLYSIEKNKVNVVNYSSKKNYRSVVYNNLGNNMFIDYLKTDKPLSDPLYIIPNPIIVETKIKEEIIIKDSESKSDEILKSSYFTLGYSIKQNMMILDNDYDMLGNFTYGYVWIGDGEKKNSIDIGVEYSPKINKSYFGDKFLEISLFDMYFNWRLPQFTNSLQSFIKFGVSHILDFKIWGDSFKSEFSFDLTKDPDGGIFYGVGILYNKKLIISAIQYKLFLNDSYHISQPQTGYIVPPFNPTNTITEPEIDILKINISRLF